LMYRQVQQFIAK